MRGKSIPNPKGAKHAGLIDVSSSDISFNPVTNNAQSPNPKTPMPTPARTLPPVADSSLSGMSSQVALL